VQIADSRIGDWRIADCQIADWRLFVILLQVAPRQSSIDNRQSV